MNPLTNVKNITKLNETELSRGTVDKKSWHDMYKDSAWIFIGGLPYGLTEGDVLAVFSQYGEIVNINLVRDKKTGKTKGFCFLCYANQKSTILAVDNFNAIKLLNRTIRVDHVLNYKPPKDNEHDDEITKQLKSEGCAPKPINQETSPAHNASASKKKKSKKEKKKHKKDKKETDEKSHHAKSKIKKEKHDPGYDKYELPQNVVHQSSKAKKSRTADNESSTSDESPDERFANSKKQNDERVHNKNIDKTHNRASSNNFNKYNKAGDKRSSHQKQDLSDSDSDYLDQKKSKTIYSEDTRKILSDGHHSKHKSKSRQRSGSSEESSPNNERKRAGKYSGYNQQNTSQSNFTKKVKLSDRREKMIDRHHDSSSEDDNDHDRHLDQSKGRDSLKHSRSGSSHFKDRKNSHERHSRGYDDDYRNADNNYNQSDSRREHKKDDQYSRINTDESRQSAKYSDKQDYKSYDKREFKNSYESSMHSKSTLNIKSSSTEREDRHSKHRNRDEDKKNWYEKRKK